MGFWKKVLNITERTPAIREKNWKQGMWVMTLSGKVGILYRLGEQCAVYVVHPSTGETTMELVCPLTELRQAIWGEIPECRRGITKEQAEALGYGS